MAINSFLKRIFKCILLTWLIISYFANHCKWKQNEKDCHMIPNCICQCLLAYFLCSLVTELSAWIVYSISKRIKDHSLKMLTVSHNVRNMLPRSYFSKVTWNTTHSLSLLFLLPNTRKHRLPLFHRAGCQQPLKCWHASQLNLECGTVFREQTFTTLWPYCQRSLHNAN